MHQGRELLIGSAAAVLATIALTLLWLPGGWAGEGALAWAPSALDAVAGLFLVVLMVAAVRARLDFVRGGARATTLVGAVAVGALFAVLLVGLFSGGLYALAAKHGLYQPFIAPPTRLETFAFFANEAAKGAFFDVLDVFALNLPGAATFDPRARWGFAALVVVFRFMAALAVWSLIFATIAKRAAAPIVGEAPAASQR